MKDWNLSEKRDKLWEGNWWYHEKFVKEFIKRLKGKVPKFLEDNLGEGQEVQKLILFGKFCKIIDKLAGSALTELPYKTYTDPKLAGCVKGK